MRALGQAWGLVSMTVRSDDDFQRYYTCIWSKNSPTADYFEEHHGAELYYRPQIDVSVAREGPDFDPIESYRERLRSFAALPESDFEDNQKRQERAVARYHTGQIELALEDLDVLASQERPSLNVLLCQTLCLARLQREEEAKLAQQRFDQHPKNSDSYRSYVAIQLPVWLGRWEEAKTALAAAYKEFEHEAEDLYNVAMPQPWRPKRLKKRMLTNIGTLRTRPSGFSNDFSLLTIQTAFNCTRIPTLPASVPMSVSAKCSINSLLAGHTARSLQLTSSEKAS